MRDNLNRTMDYHGAGFLIDFLIAFYCSIFFGLAIFGAHRYWLVNRYYRFQHRVPAEAPPPDPLPCILIQLPIYNELYVAERLIRAVAALEYPRELLEIQVLDDSDDETAERMKEVADELAAKGVRIRHLRRPVRTGYKAGALAWGLEQSTAPLIAMFDADFVPQPDFLMRTVGHFSDPEVGMVQTRWGHLNEDFSLLTQIQAIMLNGHFVIEHGSRSRMGCFFNFNGTAGLWRREAIESAGGWEYDTVTEDLDLSFRAQMAGWRFLYRPDLATPAEVPVNILAFKTQQQRWTKGSMQTARKLLGPIWRSPIRLACKFEVTMQLLGNLTYVLLVALGLALFPVYAARHFYGLDWIFWVDIPMLIFGTGALASFYANAERELGRSPWRAIAYLPLLMAVGMGMAVNNAWAVLDGLFRPGGEFVRTPKYRIESTKDAWRRKSYPGRPQRWIPIIEGAFFVYFAVTAIFCIMCALWWTLPFLVLFLAGFGYIAGLTMRQSGSLKGRSSTHRVATKRRAM